MINTLGIKKQQLDRGYFSIGSGSRKLLIIGSCRAVPYANYFHKWDQDFTINFIDPFNWHWNAKNERVDYAQAIEAQEHNEALLKMISETDVFIHEHYQNAGMFNVFKDGKNIYQFGMKAPIDIMLPNFNDIFLLVKDIVDFNSEIRKAAVQDYNVIGKLSDEVLSQIREIRNKNLNKFYDICLKSDFPEFKQIFEYGHKEKRYYWNFNHVAKEFTLTLFALINGKYLRLPISDEFMKDISSFDMYENIYTPLTEYDEGYNFKEKINKLIF